MANAHIVPPTSRFYVLFDHCLEMLLPLCVLATEPNFGQIFLSRDLSVLLSWFSLILRFSDLLAAACNSKTLGTLQGGSNSYVAHFRCVTTLSRKPRGHILNTRFENKPDTRSIMLYFTTFCRQHTDADAARRCCSSTLRFYSDTLQWFFFIFNNHSVE